MSQGNERDLCTPRKRRRTVIDETSELMRYFKSSMDQIQVIWEKIGLEEDARVERLKQAYDYIRAKVEELVESETTMQNEVESRTSNFLTEIAQFRQQLGMTDYEVPQGMELGTIKLYTLLGAERGRLKDEISKQADSQQELKLSLTTLLRRLEMAIENEPFVATAATAEQSLSDSGAHSDSQQSMPTLLSPSEWCALRDRHKELEATVKENLRQLTQLQDDMSGSLATLDRVHETVPNRSQVNALLRSDFTAPDVICSTRLLQEYEETASALDAFYKQWCDRITKKYEAVFERLADLWTKCHIPAEQQQYPHSFDVKHHDPSVVQRMEEEADRLEVLMHARVNVYRAIDTWKALWDESVGIEESRCNPSFYQNRGGEMQRILDRERSLSKCLLPAAEMEISTALGAHRVAHPEDAVCYEGMDPIAYVKYIQDEHRNAKQLKKTRADNVRTASRVGMSSPIRPGSKATTPRSVTTPGNAAAARRTPTSASKHIASHGSTARKRLNMPATTEEAAATTPKHSRREQPIRTPQFENTNSLGAISNISPIRDAPHPKTSSPKPGSELKTRQLRPPAAVLQPSRENNH